MTLDRSCVADAQTLVEEELHFEGQVTSQNSVRDFCDFEITSFSSVTFL